MAVVTTKEAGTVSLELYSKGITNAQYYIYRERKGYRKVVKRKFILLETKLGKIQIEDIKARRQFLNHIGLGLQETERIYDIPKRNETLMNAIKDRSYDELMEKKKPLVFRCHKLHGINFAWSVVTPHFSVAQCGNAEQGLANPSLN